MFSYLTLGTNRAMFTYLTQGTNRVFLKYYSTKKYSPEMRVIYTNFIRALLNHKFNLDASKFNKNDEIISYLENFQGDKLFSRNHITVIKQGDFERVPLTPKSKEFIKYVQKEFPDFDGFEFTLIKPITKEEGKSLVNNKNTLKHELVKLEPTTKETTIKPITKESTIIKTIPTSTTVNGTSKETITETITKYVEPAVTETIVKMVEPVAKVVDPVIKVVENVANIPNIIINNANTNSAHATTVTSNTQVASSSWDTLFGLFGLNKIFKLIKEIFGWEGDGTIYLLIQLPYLVWFLLSLKDNPDIMKYLTDTFGVEEYKAPSTELAPIEYDFEAPMNFDADDSNFYPWDSSEEEASKDYTNNSAEPDIEYFDYFDYYHSKDNTNENIPKEVVEDLKELKEELKDVGNNLLDSTKDKVGTIVTAITELEPLASHKDKPEIHVIDDQFSGAIDVFPVAQEVQSLNNKLTNNSYKITSNKSSIGGFFKWLFPMLDFDSLYYHPSYFEKFNLNTKVQPITNKVDYVKMLINELYYTLNLGKFEIPQVKFNLPEFGKVTSSSKAQSHADTLSILEGVTPNTKRTPNWRNTSLISDNTTFSTYYNRSWNKPRDILLPSIPSVNSDVSGWGMNPPRSDDVRTPPRTPSLFVDTNNATFYNSFLPSVNSRQITPLSFADYSVAGDTTPNETSPSNAVATQRDTKIGVHDWINIEKAINEVEAEINNIKHQLIDFHHKMTSFTDQMTELTKQKLQYTEKSNNGKLSYWDRNALKKVLNQLEYIDGAKARIEGSMDADNLNDKLKSLEIKKTSLLELKEKYKKLLGNIATTPNV